MKFINTNDVGDQCRVYNRTIRVHVLMYFSLRLAQVSSHRTNSNSSSRWRNNQNTFLHNLASLLFQLLYANQADAHWICLFASQRDNPTGLATFAHCAVMPSRLVDD